jgi:hypothetical protein
MLLPLIQNLYDRGPQPGAVLASSSTVGAWWSGGAIDNYTGMDGIPRIEIFEGQRPALYALMRDRYGAPINQAAVQAVRAYVFDPTVAGVPVSEDHPAVADAVYDEIQYGHPRPEGYNVAHVFEYSLTPYATGGSVYQMELAVELTTGEVITQVGRVLVQPTLHAPANAYNAS